MKQLRAHVSLLFALGLVSCSTGGPTTMFVDIQSRLEVPADLDGLRIQITGDESVAVMGGMLDQTFALTAPFPATYRVYPHAGYESEMVTITVTGTLLGNRRIDAQTRAMFVAGTEVLVRIDLVAECVDVTCPAGVVCVGGLCPGLVDGGGMDAMPRDAGFDAMPCVPSGSEVCDAIDNDCNGVVDDGFDLQSDDANCGRCGVTCGALPNGDNRCEAGLCTLMCDAGRADCDGIAADGCEADLSTSATCGACATSCTGATPACQAGATGAFACVSGCSAPTPTLCSGSCVDLASSPANCGSCGMSCPTPPGTVATCAASLCGTVCRLGFDDCDMMIDNGCEADLGSSLAHCGACANACMLPNARPACASGACVIGSCDPGFLDCNMLPDDGCETQLATLTDCTGCGVACARANAVADCSSGTCGWTSCDPGFGDCDALASSGCETPLTTLVNCGGCGSSCSRMNATPTCATGTCAIGACSAGFGDCDGSDATGCETSLRTTTDCGSCSAACVRPNATTSCLSGSCAMTACVAGFGDCDSDPSNGCETPLNTLTDCRTCGTVCDVPMGTPTCTSGTCTSTSCRPGYADCDMSLANGCETSLDTLTNCGTCGTACDPANAFGSCSTFTCRVASCDASFGDCDLVATNGCETPLTTLANCSTCGTACSRPNAMSSCASGTCTLGACSASFGNCDMNESNGCEATLTTLTNCGTCGTACARANATPTCAAGTCQIASCNAGFDDCDAMSANGCEASLTTLTNCAACGVACTRANATASCATGSCALSSCNAGFGNCDLAGANGCEAPLTTAANCGACGIACTRANASSSCATGSCVLGTCNAGFGNCDGNAANGCEAPLTTAANCGMCGIACTRANAASSCATGSCVLGACNAGFGNCDGMAANGCETPLTSLTSCGGCGTTCARANATATCGTGSCQIVTCNAGFGNCDGNDANGCETALVSLTNCGMCGAACSRAGATATCATGSCAISSCSAGFGNCDATDANGCETSLTTLTNCATCGTSCSRPNAMASCATGTCTLGACSSGFGNCDAMPANGCETPLTTLTNCASCGTVCDIAGSGETCASGMCVATTCSSGFGDCDGNSANGCEQMLTTLTHCGACATACARANATPTCSTGSCAISSCSAGFGNCDGTDANGCETSLTTLASCGTCGTACSRANATATCGSGSCAIASCNPGFSNCDGNDANGCETALNTLTNCMTCGTTCTRASATATCASGSCAISSCNASFANCDLVDSNGCETSLTTLANCVTCGTTCSRANATASCASGSCAISSCNGGFGNCDGNGTNGCETSLTTLTNCSTCGTACSRANATATCGGGSCAISSCNAGFGSCDAMDANGCEAALTSLSNCGSCGTACTRANATPTCSTGSCAISSCSLGFGNCDSTDANGCEVALTSLGNCGSCGTACSRTNATATCSTGSCQIASCNAGFGDCDGNSLNGCEQQLNTLTHCAVCSTACTRANATATCAAGSCAISSCSAGFGDCDGTDSNGCEAPLTSYYRDADTDGYGTGAAVLACTPPAGHVANNTDCDDGNPAINPGRPEICGNSIDDNCAGGVDEGCAAGTCSGSTAVPLPGGRFSVTLGPNVHTGTCPAGGSPGSEAYLSFTVTGTSDAFITTLGSGIDTVVYVRSTSCMGAEVGCNDNADGSAATSSLHLTGLTAGTYNVFIDTKVPMSASLSVDIYVTDTAAVSDRCSNPTFIPAGTTSLAGTTCGYTDDEQLQFITGACSYVTSGPERMYYFYLPTSRSVSFVSCGGTTNYDTVALVRDVCTSEAQASTIACDDDGCGGPNSCTGSGYRSTLTTTLGPGLYYFLSEGLAGACPCGNYTWALTGL